MIVTQEEVIFQIFKKAYFHIFTGSSKIITRIATLQ